MSLSKYDGLEKLEFSSEDKERKNQKAQHTLEHMSIFYFRSDIVIWQKGNFSRCSIKGFKTRSDFLQNYQR